MNISVLTTLYRSSNYIENFHHRISDLIKKTSAEYEIIYVNDHSPDDSQDKVIKIIESDKNTKLIELSRNFGHHKAIMTGLKHCSGDLIFLIDVDLEEPPECFTDFYNSFIEHNKEYDVIYGVQENRKGKFFERMSGEMFYWLFNKLSFYPVPKNFVTARLMTRRYVNSLLLHEEQELFLGGLWAITGYKQLSLPIKKGLASSSTYTFRKKISLFVNSITSFSNLPLVFIFYLGICLTMLSITSGFILIVLKLLSYPYQVGWASLIISIWLIGGIIIFCLGLIGIYLSKIFIETKKRPYSIIKEKYNF
jgi:putative glycosyltransferase